MRERVCCTLRNVTLHLLKLLYRELFRLGATCCAVVREEKYSQNVDPKNKIVSTI
jgi:hypothetical protein